MNLTWYGYSVTPPLGRFMCWWACRAAVLSTAPLPLLLLFPLLLQGLFTPGTGCCWPPAAFPELGDPFLLSGPPTSPRELGLDPSLCPWGCEFVGAQLEVCTPEGLPWLVLDGPLLGLGVGVWLGLGEGDWDDWWGGWDEAAAEEEEEEGRKGGQSRDPGHPGAPVAPTGPGGPWEPYLPIREGGEEVGDKSHWSRVRTMRTASCLSWVRWVAQTSQRLSRSFQARRELLGTWSLSWRRREKEGSWKETNKERNRRLGFRPVSRGKSWKHVLNCTEECNWGNFAGKVKKWQMCWTSPGHEYL